MQSNVQGYLLECREVGRGDWAPISPELLPETDATIPGLRPGSAYEFRVSAQSEAGLGPPSQVTNAIEMMGLG